MTGTTRRNESSAQIAPEAGKAQDALAAARRLMNDRKWLEAISQCDRAIQLAPKLADGYHCRADAAVTAL